MTPRSLAARSPTVKQSGVSPSPSLSILVQCGLMGFDRGDGEMSSVGETSLLRDAPGASRLRFAVAGIVLALAIAVGGSVLARLSSLGGGPTTFLVAAVVLGVLGVRLGQSLDSLERKALQDPMTCVGNRRHWEASLEVEVGRAIQSRMPLSVLLIDLDRLKSLNDTYGHRCGDRALLLVGEVLRATCRSRDVAARFGGDEFAVLLPRTRLSEAKIVAYRLRSELARRAAELGAPLDSAVTVSVGIADLDSLALPTPSMLFEAADRALYLAKSGGRNRVEALANLCPQASLRVEERGGKTA